MTTANRIIIRLNDCDEYEVPTLRQRFGKPSALPADHTYFTNDRDDAIATAKHVFGADCDVRIVRRHDV